MPQHQLQRPRLRLPPYAKAHAASAAAGYAPVRYICIAGDWTLNKTAVFKHASWRAVVPPENTPDEFDWRWCAAFEVLVIARSQSRLDAIGKLLARYAKRMVGACVETGAITIYRKP